MSTVVLTSIPIVPCIVVCVVRAAFQYVVSRQLKRFSPTQIFFSTVYWYCCSSHGHELQFFRCSPGEAAAILFRVANIARSIAIRIIS